MTFNSYQFNQQIFAPANSIYLVDDQSVTAGVNCIEIPNRFTEPTGNNYVHLYFTFPALAENTTITIIGQTDFKDVYTEVIEALATTTFAQALNGFIRVSSIIFSESLEHVSVGYLKQYSLYSRDGTITSHGVTLSGGGGSPSTKWTLEAALYQQSRITTPFPPDRIFYGLGASFTNQTTSTANLLYLENPVGKLKMIVEATEDADEPEVVWQFGARRLT